MNLTAFNHAVAAGMSCGDWTEFERWLTLNSSFSYNYAPTEPPIPDSEFEAITAPLRDQAFLATEGPSRLLQLVEYEWCRLTFEQQSVAVNLIGDIFEQTEDRIAWFLMCEILGEYASNESALALLSVFSKSAIVEKRGLSAMGLGKLASHASNSVLVGEIIEALMAMNQGESESIRDEIEKAMNLARMRLAALKTDTTRGTRDADER